MSQFGTSNVAMLVNIPVCERSHWSLGIDWRHSQTINRDIDPQATGVDLSTVVLAKRRQQARRETEQLVLGCSCGLLRRT